MRIYFAGSMRGGDSDSRIYGQLIDGLRGCGEVLTEAIFAGSRSEEGMLDVEIFERDMRWLREADCVVADVTQPSHGVGSDIREAVRLKVPVLCLHRQEIAAVSAMLTGDPFLRFLQYRVVDDVLETETIEEIKMVTCSLVEWVEIDPELWKPLRKKIIDALALDNRLGLQFEPPKILRREYEAMMRFVWARVSSGNLYR